MAKSHQSYLIKLFATCFTAWLVHGILDTRGFEISEFQKFVVSETLDIPAKFTSLIIHVKF